MGRGPEGDLPDCTRWEGEERVPEWKRRAGERGRPRGGGKGAEGRCAGGGSWVFQGDRER
jgi:hypothetical protein